MRVALYARYSSDNQSENSITDQLRLCRLHAERQGWQIIEEYSDHAVSGASLLRPGVQALMQDAQRGRFDVVLAEAMDRLSRDQEDIAGMFKRLSFAGVRIVTLSEGDVSHLHVSLKGTMNALFLEDLAMKTRRGLRGRIEAGKSGGGNSYGYTVDRRIGADGLPVTGERVINPAEADIVRRIFREYAHGASSRAIAWGLNKDSILGPFGHAWGPSTIHGNPKRGNGVLNNCLYIGKLVWGRQRFVKDPETGKRVSRPNPESEWVIHDVPALRILDDDLWRRVKERQRALAYKTGERGANPLLDRRRPKHLLAGRAKCGRCGGGYTLISGHLLGCATARNKGSSCCGNRLNIRRDTLETSVLNGLRTHLMQPALFKEFCDEFTREVNRLRMEERASLEAARAELTRIDHAMEKLLQALIDETMPPSMIKEKSTKLEARKAELTALLANAAEPPPLLHPKMAEVWRERVAALHEALRDEAAKADAFNVLRSLVDRVTLVPEGDGLVIELRGDLAAMLGFAANKKRSPSELGDLEAQLSLVAGVGFEPTTFRL